MSDIDSNINPQEKAWLVRSSLKIVGPFNLQELTQLIAARHISIIDEVRQPNSRWSYIREHSIFMDLVKTLREEQEATVEKTMASTTQNTATQKLGMTKTDWIQGEEYTPTPVDFTSEQEQEIRDVQPISHHFNDRKKTTEGEVRTYGVSSDLSWQNRRSVFGKRLRYAFMGVVIVLLVGIYLRHVIKTQEREESLNRIERLAHLHFTQGLADKSLLGFQRVQEFRPLSEPYVYDLGVLLIDSGRSIEGRRLLEKTLEHGNMPRERHVETLNALGVSFIEDRNWEKAQEVLAKAAGLDNSNLFAKMNLLQLKLIKGSYRNVYEEAQSILSRNSQELELRLIKNIAAIELIKNKNLSISFEDIEQEMRQLAGRRHYLSQHLLLTYLSLATLLSADQHQLDKIAWMFINTFPFQRNKFYTNFQLSKKILKWESYLPHCQRALERHPRSAFLRLSLAYCFLEMGSESEALRLIEGVLSEDPVHPTATVMRSLYLLKVGKASEALASLDAVNTSSIVLSQYVRVLSCEQQAVNNCSGEASEKIIKQRKNDSVALYFYSEYLLTNGQRKSAWDLVARGLTVDPNYMPLIDLRGRLEGALD